MLLIDGPACNTILMANSSFLRMSGLDNAQIVGSPLATALAGMMDAKNIAYITKRLALNQPATWELDSICADGSTTPMCVFDFPLFTAGLPEPQHILSFHEPRKASSPSRPTAAEMQALYAHAPGFVAMSEGPDHRVIFANESYKQYVGKSDLEGLTVAEAMPEAVEQGFVSLLDNVFKTGIPFHGKGVPYEFQDPESGEMIRRYSDFVYAPVRDADANIVGLFCEGYDITKQKTAEASVTTLQTQVVHSARVNAMGTMATTMAHEMNQPLTAILNYAAGALRLLERPGTDTEIIRQAMLSIQESGDRAASIIRTLRDLTDRRPRAHAEFQLRPVITEALNLVRNSCSVDTQLHADIAADLDLRADRVQIQQVIINLVRNGCDAVSGSKEQMVSVAAELLGNDVVVSVRDTGPGLAAESAQNIFTWVDSSKESGMGLGLSISRTIIESHGGRIWLEDSSASGSEFCFSLPHKPPELS
jgi:two-component system sensor kinase FixL